MFCYASYEHPIRLFLPKNVLGLARAKLAKAGVNLLCCALVCGRSLVKQERAIALPIKAQRKSHHTLDSLLFLFLKKRNKRGMFASLISSKARSRTRAEQFVLVIFLREQPKTEPKAAQSGFCLI